MFIKKVPCCLLVIFAFPIFIKAQLSIDTLDRLLLALDDTIQIYAGNELWLNNSLGKDAEKKEGTWFDLDKNAGAWEKTYQFRTRGDVLDIKKSQTQVLIIPATNGLDTAYYALNFLNSAPYFPAAYQEENKGRCRFEIPFVFELLHIALALSNNESVSEQLTKPTNYYHTEVLKYFAPFKNHPLIQSINECLKSSNPDSTYHQLCRDILSLEMNQNNIQDNGIYSRPYRINPWVGTFYAQLKDFARKSDFFQFYNKNAGYYQKLIREQEQFMVVDSIWQWLEQQLPARISSHRIIFSPLKSYEATSKIFLSAAYQETIVLVSSPEELLQKDILNYEKRKERVFVAFQQLLPFYQASFNEKYKENIIGLFDDQSYWVAQNVKMDPLNIFAEYWSHALFGLYVEQHFSPTQVRSIRTEIENKMLEMGFIRFYAFSRNLLSLFEKDEGAKNISILFEEFLEGQ